METGSLVVDPTQGANRIALTYSDVPRAVLDETFDWHGCGAARFNLILPLLTHRCFIRYLGPYWRSCGITLHPRHPSPVPSDPTNMDFPHGTGTSLRCNTRRVYLHSTHRFYKPETVMENKDGVDACHTKKQLSSLRHQDRSYSQCRTYEICTDYMSRNETERRTRMYKRDNMIPEAFIAVFSYHSSQVGSFLGQSNAFRNSRELATVPCGR